MRPLFQRFRYAVLRQMCGVSGIRPAVSILGGIVALLLTLPAHAQDATQPCTLPQDEKAFASYMDRGTTATTQGDYQAALAAYTCAISLNPNDASAYNSRGKVYLDDLDQYAQAADDFSHAIALDPQNPQLYNRRGAALHNLGKIDLALADYNQAITLKPDFALAFNNRGLAYRDMHDYNSAKADLNRAISLGVTPASMGYTNLGLVYLDSRDLEPAENNFHEAIQRDPTYASAYLGLADTYYLDLRYDQALETYRQYVQLVGDKAPPYVLKNIEDITNRTSYRAIPIILVAVAALLVLAVVGLYWRERRRASRTLPPAPPKQDAGSPPSGAAHIVSQSPSASQEDNLSPDNKSALSSQPSGRNTSLLVALPIVAVAVGTIAYVLARGRKPQ